ncbi:MAG TPA: ATP-binding cassette domain-containing protein, partial [Bacteroidetes bacterium]|nr:ATP-binding cassette domain-containing protein [Bacteroidota bacterium]
NGAGKTTTIRMIMGIILPDGGTIKIFDQRNSIDVLDRVGYLPEERGLYKKMKVGDVLHFFGELKGMKKAFISSQIDYWLKKFELSAWKEKKVEDLSRGMQQKLQIIVTIMHEPKLIILDEPFTGLDPVNTNLVKDVILDLKQKGTTIIFSTHLMEQVEKLCDSILLIDKGKSVLQGDLHQVKSRFSHDRIKLQYSGDAKFLKENPAIEKYDDYGNYVEIRLKDGENPQKLLRDFVKVAEVYRFEIVEPSLNEIFIETVKSEN